MKFCGDCGGQNRDQARFCGHCGHPLSPPTVELRETPWVAEGEGTDARAEGRTPKVSFGMGVVVGIALLVLGQTFWTKSPAPPPEPKPLEDLVENRRAMAERYQAAEKLEERFTEAVHEQAKQLPTGLHELLFTRIIHNVRIDKLKSAERDLLVKYFTVQDLEALTRFYETAEGAAIQKKLAKVTEELQPLVMAEALHAVQETLREFQGPPSGRQSSKDM
jgi:hypothetical protein